MRWRGIFSGVVVLAGLQAVLSTKQSADRAGGLLVTFGNGVRHFLSPFEPAIPDLRDKQPDIPPLTTPPPPTGGSPRGGTRPVVPTTPGDGGLRA